MRSSTQFASQWRASARTLKLISPMGCHTVRVTPSRSSGYDARTPGRVGTVGGMLALHVGVCVVDRLVGSFLVLKQS